MCSWNGVGGTLHMTVSAHFSVIVHFSVRLGSSFTTSHVQYAYFYLLYLYTNLFTYHFHFSHNYCNKGRFISVINFIYLCVTIFSCAT